MITRMRCTRRVIWDNWGQMVTAFAVGDVVDVESIPDDPEYGTAESPYHRKIVDYVPLTHFEPA